MFIILCVGLIISIIISWIYDITPEGIEKTKPAHKVTKEGKPLKSNSWKIASYISFVVIVALIVLNIIPRSMQNSDTSVLDKSLAVLPFKYLSDDPEKQYLADGAMNAILLHLSKIEDLRVMARTSVEQYRETDKTATIICQELDVAILLEGSFQKYGDQARLIVQLIRPGIEGHMWANEYDRDWKDIFSVQSEVAQSIARELQAIITPEENQLIEKVPTTSLTAYHFYQRAREEYWKYWFDKENNEALDRAQKLYLRVLEYDSTYAQSYTGLALIYSNKHLWDTYYSENFLDSMLSLANLALSYDDQLSDAYTIKGDYYFHRGLNERAIEEYDKAIKLNPNDWMPYSRKGLLYFNDDLVKSIYNYQKAASIYHGSQLPHFLRRIGIAHFWAGFTDIGKYYYQEALKLDDDSVAYYKQMALFELYLNNNEKAIEFGNKGYTIDSNNTDLLYILAHNHMFLEQYKESLNYFKRYYERLKEEVGLYIYGRLQIGFVYLRNGFKEEADYYLNEALNHFYQTIKLGRREAVQLEHYYALASWYAFNEEKDKVYENLRIFNQKPTMTFWRVYYIADKSLWKVSELGSFLKKVII